jgi:glycosyltransferase involved in cell wall biosynthesis
VKLSVIIPYFNTKTLTLKLLDALSKQITDEVEVILVDDGCYEKDFEKYAAKVVQIPNGGVSKARNTGLGIAIGDFITFVDSDDFIGDSYIRDILHAINTKDFDYCYFGWRSTRGNMTVTGEPPAWNTSVWNCIYKRPTARFNENKQISEDLEFNKLARVGKKSTINKILYIYNNQREDSLTRKYCKGEITIDKEIKTKIVIYRSFLSLLGGIETAIYNFCEEFRRTYDITFIYDTADHLQLFRLRKLINCVKYEKQKIDCEIFIFYGISPTAILDTVTASEIIQQICCDVKVVNVNSNLHPRISQVFADSQHSAKSFTDKHPKIKCGVLHNVFVVSERKRVLHLMTASRLSPEKGYERMKRMAKRMNQLKIPFTWEIFTNEKPDEEIDGMFFRKPRLNVRDYMNGKDYGIQVSDTESWCCTATEFLLAGVPMVLTDFQSSKEQVKDGKNGFILNRDLSNLDLTIQNMYETKFSDLDYVIHSVREWKKLLGKKQESEYKYKPRTDLHFVKSLRNYYDTVLERHVGIGDVFECSKTRLEMLENNAQNIKFVERME